MHDSFLALGRTAVVATNDSCRKKFQIPRNFQKPITKKKNAQLRRSLLWNFYLWDFLGVWALGFGPYSEGVLGFGTF
jgi:hypothetical protein